MFQFAFRYLESDGQSWNCTVRLPYQAIIPFSREALDFKYQEDGAQLSATAEQVQRGFLAVVMLVFALISSRSSNEHTPE